MTDVVLDPAGIDRLRAALVAAGYTGTGVADRLGPAAVRAVERNDFRDAVRATAGGDPQATLIRLFICGRTEPAAAVAAALPLADYASAGLIERTTGGYRAGSNSSRTASGGSSPMAAFRHCTCRRTRPG